MDKSNCWYTSNFNFLPDSLTNQMKALAKFSDMKRDYTIEQRDMILSRIFSNDSRAEFTPHHFCLPNFNLIGFDKTGSTFLYNYLKLHPLLATPHSKEGHFWMISMEIDDPKYRELAVLLYLYHFSEASRQININPDMFTVDASVSVAPVTHRPLKQGEKDACVVPLIISKTMPKMKLLAQTRQPVERLWSDFLYFCRPSKAGNLDTTPYAMASLFHNYTIRALQEFKACTESGHTQFHCTALAGSYPGPQAACKRVRIGISMYYVHLVKWFHLFPREQLHVTRLEDLVSDPSGTMDEVWTFLGVPPQENFQRIGETIKGHKWKNDFVEFQMLPETRKLLGDFFHPYNVRLAELLGDERYLWNES